MFASLIRWRRKAGGELKHNPMKLWPVQQKNSERDSYGPVYKDANGADVDPEGRTAVMAVI